MSDSSKKNESGSNSPVSERNSLRMPTTNVYARGGHSITISFGSELDTAELILDTGSSTLVVTQEAYESKVDKELQATTFAQCIRYGMGGWYGPVVKTGVDMICHDGKMILDDAHVAIATEFSEGSFAKADGILGLAFHSLNDGHCLQEYLLEQKIEPSVTYPWSATQIESQPIKEFKSFLRGKPKEDIKPYFTRLEEMGISPNKFAFMAHRSSIHHAEPNLPDEVLKQDPLNQGMFILGGGEEDYDLYEGEFIKLKVIDDVYYNVRLMKVKVDGFEAFDVPKLKGKELERHHSNAFIDTGASYIVLDNVVFEYIMQCLESIKPAFKDILEPFHTFEFKEEGVPMEKVNLDEWPDIEFIFQASDSVDAEEVSLMCHAHDYWQVNSPTHGEVCFKFASQLPGWPDQSILGLPLMSGYYTIFARFVGELGEIKIAKAKAK